MKLLNSISKLFKVDVNPTTEAHDVIQTEGGLKLFRHLNGKCTVIEFDYWVLRRNCLWLMQLTV